MGRPWSCGDDVHLVRAEGAVEQPRSMYAGRGELARRQRSAGKPSGAAQTHSLPEAPLRV